MSIKPASTDVKKMRYSRMPTTMYVFERNLSIK